MSAPAKIKSETPSFKKVLSVVKNFSAEEKQLLRLQLVAPDALAQMKAFELQLKKKKPATKKTDAEIVALTTSIRKKKYANTKKMLH